MKLASEQASGFWNPRPPALDAALTRLDALSLRPEFAFQRELALARSLKPYLESGAGRVLAPLPHEVELATLSLFCDFYPEDGQLTLIEQLRDVVTEHISQEERRWLDPLKHSYIDLLELTGSPKPGADLALRSIGDRTVFMVPGGAFATEFVSGQVLLTRVIRDPDEYESGKGVLAGCGIVLAAADAQALYEATGEWRREMEMSSGSFALGEWQEFAKRFAHIVLWNLAQMRFAALADAVGHIRYRTSDGEPYLYVLALYDHHEYRFLAQGLSEMKDLQPDPSGAGMAKAEPVAGSKPVLRWIQREGEGSAAGTVARVTLTSSQLVVECDTPDRLNTIKHQLAAAFGFSLHFRDETLTPPLRQLSVSDLMSDEPMKVAVTSEDDIELLGTFLDKAYLEWSDQAHLSLGGKTPRHAAASSETRGAVGELIAEMERNDPGLRRTGRRAFDYNKLRAHVGLEEVL
jgi:hypothetical protein